MPETNLYKAIIKNWWLMRIIYGSAFILSGADKIFGIAVNWNHYGVPAILSSLGVTLKFSLYARGIIEIAIGGLLFSPYILAGSYLAFAWLIFSAWYVFASIQSIDLAARYLVIGINAIVLVNLTKLKSKFLNM